MHGALPPFFLYSEDGQSGALLRFGSFMLVSLRDPFIQPVHFPDLLVT
jgi:hypothetical protein